MAKNVVTVIGNPMISSKILLNENYNMICNDIQYLEGVFEILEYREDVDILVVSADMLGKTDVNEFVDNVFSYKDKIEIIFIDESIDNHFENELFDNSNYKLIYSCEDIEFIKRVLEQEKNKLEKNVKSVKIFKEKIKTRIQMIYTKCELKVIEILLKLIKNRKEI